MGAAVLTILRDGEAVRSVPIEGEALLGRSDGCLIRLDDRAVSRQHALFRPVAGGLQVERKSDFAPLAVNGAECTSAVLKEGDIIAIGPYLVRVNIEKAARSARVAPESLAPAASPAPVVNLNSPPTSLAATIQHAPAQAPMAQSESMPTPTSMSTVDAAPLLNLNALGGGETASATPASAMPADAGAPFLEPPPGASKLGETVKEDGGTGVLKLSALPSAERGAMNDASFPPVLGSADIAASIPSLQSSQAASQISPDGVFTGSGAISGAPAQPETNTKGTGRTSPTNGGLGIPSIPDPSASNSASADGATNVGAAGGIDVKLVINPGDANYTEYDISSKPEISIGRGNTCELILNDKKVSRKHAVIIRNGHRFTIKDLKSANGIYVNSVRVDEQDLESGDRIRIGSIEFTFVAKNPMFEQQQRDFVAVSTVETGELQQAGQRTGSGLASLPQDLGGVLMPAPGQGYPAGGGMPSQQPGMNPGQGSPGIGGIPGLAGTTPRPKSLMEKFRALPKRRQYIWIVIVIGLVYFLLFDDEPEKKARNKNAKPIAQASVQPSGAPEATFDSLTPDQKRFIENQHALAFDYYRNREYDKALFEIQKIFSLVPDYKDSREIERYAREGQRKLEAMQDEQRRKDEEAKLKAKIASLVEETRNLMVGKHYDQARELFAQILALDPDNKDVAQWRQTLEDYDEQQRLAQQEKQVQDEINQRAWGIYKDGMTFKKQGKFHLAIGELAKVTELGPTDKRVVAEANEEIARCRAAIVALRDPVLAEAKDAEGNGDLPKAFALYQKSTVIDPPFQEGYRGMARIRTVLHDRAKTIYTEAVLAESYSDFASAKKKYHEVLSTAPNDDIYHDRAERKLAHYFEKEDTQQ